MKQLTDKEIKFVKETGFTPTVWQCSEWNRTIFTDEKFNCSGHSFKDRDEYNDKWFSVASDYAKEKYGFDLTTFLNKNLGIDLNDSDGISIEFVATYLLYCFFTKEELENLSNQKALDFLQDYRYYFGFRKWYVGDMHYRMPYIDEAIEVYNGERVFYLQDDGNVWNTRRDEISGNSYFDDKVILEEPILKGE